MISYRKLAMRILGRPSTFLGGGGMKTPSPPPPGGPSTCLGGGRT